MNAITGVGLVQIGFMGEAGHLAIDRLIPVAILVGVVIQPRQHLVRRQGVRQQDLVIPYFTADVPLLLIDATRDGLHQLVVDDGETGGERSLK